MPIHEALGDAVRARKEYEHARESFRLVFENLAPKAEGWIQAAAKKNPAKGAELLLRLAEHFVPKIARHEVTSPA